MKTLTLLLLALTALLNAACLGHSPGEVYFEAWSKDGNGNYTVPTLYRTRDYGQTAQIVIENFDGFIHRDAKPGSFYRRSSGEGIYYSSDTCQTWTYTEHLEENYFSSSLYEGIVFDANKVSFNFGFSWVTSQCNGIGTHWPTTWGYDLGEMYSCYTSNGQKKLYRSTDYGNNFTFVSNITIPYALGVGRGWQPGELYLGTFNYQTEETKQYKSVDYGHTFEYLYTVPTNLLHATSLGGFVPNENLRYEVSRYNHPYYDSMVIKFYRTTDLYQTVDSVMTNYTTGIEENGEWRVESGELTNYPNPFNNSTVVSYELSAAGELDFAVYNAKGELVKSLYRGKQSRGIHQLTFNANGLNSGVYYLRLKAGNKLQTHKIILIK